ncbi:MAG TPA: hypothetical protein VEB00_10035 [Clostridia bacterium]|nr:hypothetical protein [Clostridia bacterium]
MSVIQNPVRISTRRITTQDDMVTIDYPAVKDMESPTVQHSINRAIVSQVDKIQDIIDEEGALGIMTAGD